MDSLIITGTSHGGKVTGPMHEGYVIIRVAFLQHPLKLSHSNPGSPSAASTFNFVVQENFELMPSARH